MSTSSPSPSALAALASQVGGHSGVLTTEDGLLIIKPALALERAFYQALAEPTDSESFHVAIENGFAALRPFIPRFYGTLTLEGKIADPAAGLEGGLLPAAPPATNKDSLVLENLSHPFIRPNIMDIKLGTVLYDESANEEKVERMKQAARDTTSEEAGVRLTGFQVYDNVTGQAVNTPKSYGKSIKVSDLPDGIRQFFPSSPPDNTGLPLDTLLPILRAIYGDMSAIRDALARIEMRMVGGSVLVVYEADWERAAELLKGGAASDMQQKNEEESDEEETEEVKPYTVKLIDFAHTRLKPGEGPDVGVLKGLDTVLALMKGRISELEAMSAA